MVSEGIARNIFNTIDGIYYAGADSVITENSDARGGQIAKGYGPNKPLLDTKWSTVNAWGGPHQLAVRWFTDTTKTYGLTVEYWAKDAAGREYKVYSKEVNYMADISDEFGNGIGTCYFHENYRYRIIVKSHHSIAENEYVAVDYIRISPVDVYRVRSDSIYAGSDEVPSAPVVTPFWITVTGDGSSDSYTYVLPISNHYDYIYPECIAWGGGGNYNATFDSYTANSITIRVTHRNGTNWSGGVSVSGHLLTYEPIVSLKP